MHCGKLHRPFLVSASTPQLQRCRRFLWLVAFWYHDRKGTTSQTRRCARGNARGKHMNSGGRLGYVIVSGRWDNNVAIVDVERALRPENQSTPNAVVSRPHVTPDVDTNGDGIADTPASGQPVSVVVDPGARYAYIGNHSGAALPSAAERYQHGHPGLIAVLDVAKAIDPAHNGTLGAVQAFVATGRMGPVGIGLTPGGRTLLVNCGEAAESEDGGDEITAIDVEPRRVVGRIPLAEAPRHGAPGPSRHDSPHPSFGRYPNPTGLAISPLAGGIAFVGNGGFSDVPGLHLQAALGGDPRGGNCQGAVEGGPVGLSVGPDGRLVAGAAPGGTTAP